MDNKIIVWECFLSSPTDHLLYRFMGVFLAKVQFYNLTCVLGLPSSTPTPQSQPMPT